MVDLASIDINQLGELSEEKLQAAAAQLLEFQQTDRRENNLLYYQPASDEAEKIHRSKARIVGVGGGNRASKTDTVLAHMAALTTGVFPLELRDVFAEQFRGPIKTRFVCQSLKITLHPTILPKLQWWKWDGYSQQGGEKGHWGWIPKICLKGGSWQMAWSEKLCTLTVDCLDPDNLDKVLGQSIIQFMSYDQDPPDFASGSFHIIAHDEPPTYPIWQENQARVMDVGGKTFLQMTWPDDPAIPVDWIHDEVYEPGRPGPNKDPNIDWIELVTADNRNLDLQKIAEWSSGMSEAVKKVRLKGQPIRFSNRIHPLFTDHDQHWCFKCNQAVLALETVNGRGCAECGSIDVAGYNHVKEFDIVRGWPCVFLLDPHPRKPHMFCWVQVDPSDDLWMIHEGLIDGEPSEVNQAVDEIEEQFGIYTTYRLMDPNMGASPASAKRGVTWQDEFAEALLNCDLADDSDVGRGRVNEYLRPDDRTLAPRLHFHLRCQTAIAQMKRYTWDDFKHGQGKDLKQKPRDKYDDFPTLLKYLMNYLPSFSVLKEGAPVIQRPGTRIGAY